MAPWQAPLASREEITSISLTTRAKQRAASTSEPKASCTILAAALLGNNSQKSFQIASFPLTFIDLGDSLDPSVNPWIKQGMTIRSGDTIRMNLSLYVDRIKSITNRARSESKLEGEMNQILKECLSEFGVKYDPHVNESLKSMGLSQVDSSRPDGVYGHIVFDYKFPKLLRQPSELIKAQNEHEEYLDKISGSHDSNPNECLKWFGYICDGESLIYCRSNRLFWQWSEKLPMSESTLLFLVHVYRSLSRKPLTARFLCDAFGKESEVAIELIRVMCSHLSKPRHRTNMLFREWKRLFEQVSTYGLDQLPSLRKWAIENGIATQDASHILFSMHSYYSIVVKLLTSELLSISTSSTFSICDKLIATANIKDLYSVLGTIEDGEHYKRYRISNFLEGDFFSWYINEKSKPLANAIRHLASEFQLFEPASALLLPEAKQDLLKEFYSSLVDEQIRHDLGEYYTPDWLAQHLLNQIGYSGQLDAKILDPACGSGTFLVESILRLKEQCEVNHFSPLETLERILTNVKGLDLNPLAVISARANYILTIYDLVFGLGYDIELPVYLADSINVPVAKEGADGNLYLEYLLDTELDRFKLEIPFELVEEQLLGKVLLLIEEGVLNGSDFKTVFRSIRQNIPEIESLLNNSGKTRLNSFFDIVVSLEDRDWDKIWCRIVKNNFSPRGFAPFDFIIGNPPWVRWSRLPETYRARVKEFCNYYGLVSGRGYSGGIESDISTVITFSAVDNWLKNGGRIAFLITWTVFKSGSARGFRLSKLPDSSGIKIVGIEDLTGIQPFPDATNETSIYLGEKVSSEKEAKFDSVPCGIWKATKGKSRIPAITTLDNLKTYCQIEKGVACPVGDWGSPLFTGKLADFRRSSFLRGSSDYLNDSHRGTISDLARVFWVKVIRYSEETGRALIRTLSEQEFPRAKAVTPVEGAWIEADLLFPLIRGRDVGRFCYDTQDWYQIIPNQHYENVLSEEEFADQYPLTYSYFKNYEQLLKNRSTYKRYQSHLPFYVIYCVGEYSFQPFKVVWLEQQNPKQFRASVISSLDSSEVPNNLIIPDHKLYFASFEQELEAHYLSAILNSLSVRTWLGGFLLGKQIGTTIFEYMNLPKFDPNNTHCQNLAEISKRIHDRRKDTRNKKNPSDDDEKALLSNLKAIYNKLNV